MGRKIPKSRRHKKLKSVDPFYKGKRRQLLDRGASKANAKPCNPDVQEVPRRLRELFMSQQLLKEAEKNNVTKKRIRKRHIAVEFDEFYQVYKNDEDRVEGMPIFKRLPGETDDHLIRRIEKITQTVIEESKLEAKFDNRTVKEVLDDAEKNEGTKEKELTSINVERKKISDVRRKKRKDFEQRKKEKKRSNIDGHKDDFSHLQDNVQFGEVSNQPPLLSSKPRKARNSTSSIKPGSKDLLLKKKVVDPKLMAGIRREIDLSGTFLTKAAPTSSLLLTHSTAFGVDRTVKRKLLSVADRRKLDHERNVAVEAYRIHKTRQQMRRNEKKIQS